MRGTGGIICENALYGAWRALCDAQHACGARDEAETVAALERLLEAAESARKALVGV